MANSYLFGSGEPWTYEQLQQRRKIAESLMSKGTPRNVGEGLSAAGGDIAAALLQRAADKRETALRDEFNSGWNAFLGNMGGGGFGYSGASGYGGSYSSPDSPPPVEANGTSENGPVVDFKTADSVSGFDPKSSAYGLSPPPAEIAWGGMGEGMRPNSDLTGAVSASVAAKLGSDWQVVPTSGYRPGDPRYHGSRNAMDFAVENTRTGERLSWDDPRLKGVATDAASRGVRGFGAGPNYMGGNVFHFDNRPGGVGVWSDDNGTTSSGGPGAANWRNDLVAATSAQSVPIGGTYSVNGMQDGPTGGQPVRVASAAPSQYRDYMVNNLGWPEHVADGFLMNIQDESGFDPAAVGDGGNALGLVQHNGPRKAALEQFAAERGTSPTDWKTQLDFVNYELQNGEQGAGNAIFSTKTAPEAAVAVLNQFERPAEAHRARREAQYSGGAPASYGGAPAASGGPRMAQNTPNMQTIQQLAQFASSPLATPGQRMVAQAMLQQQMQGLQPQEPNYQWNSDLGQYVDLNDPNIGSLRTAQGGNENPNVQSSVMLPDNSGVVKTMRNGDVVVETVGGGVLEGQEAIDFVNAANDAYVEDQRSIYQGRREGTLQGDISLGGEAAASVKAGENAQAAGMAAFEKIPTIRGSIPKLNRVIELVDAGAATGTIASQLPAIDEATKELRLIQNQLGLDVVGSVTFGALSEGELRLALSTALPDNLEGQALKDWVTRKIAAQEKLATYYEEQAKFLLRPGNTISGWLEYVDAQGSAAIGGGQEPKPSDQPASAAPPAWMLNTSPMDWTDEQMSEAETFWGLK